MKKFFVLCIVVTCSLALQATQTIYLNTGGSSLWNQGGAVFFTHSWGSGDSDDKMTHVTGAIYSVEIPDGNNSVIFLRMKNGSTSVSWDNDLWNKTADLTIPAGKNCYTITDWDSGDKVCPGSWSSYTPPAPDPNKFYITGDSALVVDAGLAVGKAWKPNAIPSGNNSYTLSLKAGVDYKLKVTEDGTWDTAKGYSDLTVKAEGLTSDHDGNICFMLTAAGNVTVTYTTSVFKLEGSFYVKPVEKKIVKLVPSEEWKVADAKFAAWIWGNDIESQWTTFFTPVSAGNDTLQAEIVSNADSIDFVRFSPKTTMPNWDNKGEEVWGEMKDEIDYTSLVWTILDWEHGQWTPYNRPCESYGLMIDGVFHAGRKNVLQTEWLEYMLRNVELTAGQKVKLCDKCNDYATWVEETFAPTSYTFAIEDGAYKIEESGKYDFYMKFIGYGNNEIYVSKEGTYTTAVRNESEDVMMQAFFNESYDDNAPGVSSTKDYKLGLGNTRWTTLTAQADTLGKYFDLIWLPPSANGDGMGYHPKQYSNQNSNWGTAAELTTLIGALHDAGAKVVADIVINHCTGWSSWCDFPTMDFGDYGVFYPDASYICRNDEVNAEWNKTSAGACWGTATGSYDDGENWDGARDWSHDNVYVQDMFKAYLKWMRNVIGYDGFRYDKGDGFNNWHHDNYNKAAGPYIAFMECYSGTDEIQRRIAGANYNLMGLDFDLKWHVFNSFAGWDYSRGRGDCIMSRGDGRHSVTFIDSHDWFLRDDNENEFGGRGNSLTETMKPRLLQANAFLLSMPGVPCVFYPHWKKYKEFLKPMIKARKWAGVHSESEVRDEYATSTGYQATMVGKYGYLILCLGDKAHQTFDGYELMASYYAENDAGYGHDASYQIWVNRTAPIPTDMEKIDKQPTIVKGEKFLQDGKLYIRLGDKTYDIMGRAIK